MKQKTVLKVSSIHDQKNKTKAMQAITKLTGIDAVSVDRENGTLTIVGDVDPVKVATRIRKTGNCADIVSVGPPEQPQPAQKPDDEPVKPPQAPPCFCNQCQLVAVAYAPADVGACPILLHISVNSIPY